MVAASYQNPGSLSQTRHLMNFPYNFRVPTLANCSLQSYRAVERNRNCSETVRSIEVSVREGLFLMFEYPVCWLGGVFLFCLLSKTRRKLENCVDKQGIFYCSEGQVMLGLLIEKRIGKLSKTLIIILVSCLEISNFNPKFPRSILVSPKSWNLPSKKSCIF